MSTLRLVSTESTWYTLRLMVDTLRLMVDTLRLMVDTLLCVDLRLRSTLRHVIASLLVVVERLPRLLYRQEV